MAKNSRADLHVVISGVSRGLGLAIAETLLQDGYRVSGFSRSMTAEVEALGKQHRERFFFQLADIEDSDQLGHFCRQALSAHGDFYGLINNSAIAVAGILATLPEIEIQRMLSVNLKGPIILGRLVIRNMLAGKVGGRIINISSIVGSRGYNGLATYSASKAGLDGFTRSLAREVGRRRITVNSVAPGYMVTEMSLGLTEQQKSQIITRTPLGRLAELSDIVPIIRFLLSEDAALITGQTITVDGGISC